VVTRFPLGAREDVDELRQLRIPVTGGAAVPLDALAHVDLGYGRASISRENGRRYIGIRMNVRGRDLGGFVEEARARVSAQAPNPAGVTVEWGGEFENKERAMARLELVVPVALVITLLLLFKAFDSFSLAVLTLLNVPFALLGGVVGLYLAGMPMSVAAAVGFIALIGQASLNGVLVLSAVAEHRRRGEGLRASITNGCRQRLRPVLMTASLAALGLVPAALSRGIGSETQRPLAVVIVFGTLSACALTLVLLPVMYQLFVRATESVRPRLRAHRVRLASALGR
jgi:cobalt-zinc-cadmium resistance protein CzcA